MSQIILKERAAHLDSYTFLQEMLARHFHSSISHQEYLFHRTLISRYVRHVNIAKFLRQLLYRTPSEAVICGCSSH